MQRLTHAACALGMLAISHACALAQDTLLQWKWEEGQAFVYRATERMEQKIEPTGIGAGMDRELKHQHVFTIEDEVTRVTPDGISTVKRTYARVQVRLEEEGEKIEFDTDKDDEGAADPRVRPYARLAGVEIEFDLDLEGKVREVRGAADAIDRVFEVATGGMGMLQGLAPQRSNREVVRQQIENGLRFIPGRTVRRGETWSVPIEQEFPIVGTVKTETLYRYTGAAHDKGRECARIESTTEMSLKNKRNTHPSALGLDFKLERGTGEGRVLFDPDRSAVVRWEQKIDSEWSGGGEVSPDISTGFKMTLKQEAVMELISGG